ncbi:hypothetical protein ES705_48699 [subsurface metagenome]
MDQTIGQNYFKLLWYIPRQGITHLNGRAAICVSFSEHIIHILTGMFSTRMEQCYFAVPLDGKDSCGEHPRSVFPARLLLFDILIFLYKLDNLHHGIVVVYYISLSRLPDQLIVHRIDPISLFFHYPPLGRGGKRHFEVLLHLLKPVKGEPTSILQQGNN